MCREVATTSGLTHDQLAALAEVVLAGENLLDGLFAIGVHAIDYDQQRIENDLLAFELVATCDECGNWRDVDGEPCWYCLDWLAGLDEDDEDDWFDDDDDEYDEAWEED